MRSYILGGSTRYLPGLGGQLTDRPDEKNDTDLPVFPDPRSDEQMSTPYLRP